MSKYTDLVTILDKIRKEAPPEFKRYHPEESDLDSINHARSRAFIHLFLKVKFGVLDFIDRENLITDDTDDAGIDGYYIDQENRKFFFIQSKFRASENNFEKVEIALEELLSMDVERVAQGEQNYTTGKPYNSKILRLIDQLKDVPNKPKYDYLIIILANIKDKHQDKIDKLTGGFKAEIYNYDRCYSELVFPLISGTFYNQNELIITINIDSESAGHRIDYYVTTQFIECNVNALFVPTLEIARLLSKYKNSILKFNPRSYLDLAAGTVNFEIAKSITEKSTNEFALYNNGVTMLSDNTKYSDKVGRKNKAEVFVTNPQIINGGQTAFTLSRIFDDCVKNGQSFEIFENKEVLLKIITLNGGSDKFLNESDKLTLVEDISKATNQQTPVDEADRRSNDKVQVELQRLIFDEFGLYYERKKGEYADGIKNGYLDKKKLIDREFFLKICVAAQGNPSEAARGQKDLFEKNKFDSILPNANNYKLFVYSYMIYNTLKTFKKNSFGNAIKYGKFAVISVVTRSFDKNTPIKNYQTKIDKDLLHVLESWIDFEDMVKRNPKNKKYFKPLYDTKTGHRTLETNWSSYYLGKRVNTDLKEFFKI